jgi:hypothetical protein
MLEIMIDEWEREGLNGRENIGRINRRVKLSNEQESKFSFLLSKSVKLAHILLRV